MPGWGVVYAGRHRPRRRDELSRQTYVQHREHNLVPPFGSRG